MLGTLRGREGLFAGRAAQDDRARARSAAAAIGGSLDREAAARDAAVRHHTGEVEQQRARDAVEVPGLSKAALDTLKAVQIAGLTAEIPREGANAMTPGSAGRRSWYPPRGAKAAPIRAWPTSWTGLWPQPANGSARKACGMRLVPPAAAEAWSVPGVGREHQAGLDELARSFVQGRDGMALSAAWDQRVEREAKEAERQRARAEERERRGLPPEPEKDPRAAEAGTRARAGKMTGAAASTQGGQQPRTRAMSYDCRAIANAVLDLGDQLKLRLTHMAVHKVMYYAHGWHLAQYRCAFY